MNKKQIYLGYNLKYGHKGYGSLKKYPKSQIIEMPVAENLIMGTAIGLAMEGFYPVVFVERHDFLFHMLDQIVNHLDTYYQYPVVIKAIVADTKPLDAGIQHSQDYTESLYWMLKFINIKWSDSLKESNRLINKYNKLNKPLIIIENRRIYRK